MKLKLIFSFAAVTLIFLGVALYQSRQISQVESTMEVQKAEMEKRITVSAITQLLQEMNGVEISFAESSDLELAELFNTKQTMLTEKLAKVDFAQDTQAYKQLQTLKSQSAEYKGYVDELAKTMGDESLDPMTVLEQIDNLHTKALAVNKEMLVSNAGLNAAAADNAQTAQELSFAKLHNTSSIAAYAAALVFLFTLIIAFVLIRSFILPVNKLQAAVREISAGDLRQQINSPYNDELGTLSHHFDHMVERVRDMLHQTRTVASSMAVYSDSFQQSSSITAHTHQDIVRAIQEISVGAERQASQSEQCAELIQELEREVSDITEYTGVMLRTGQEATANTRGGAEAVQALQKVSEQSQQSVSRVYEAMNKLAGQSQDISRITNSITEISAQTNILSLNASIEAARAGAYGKGFAVIADEVRQLSDQTKQSSGHIKEIINDLLSSMEDFQTHILDTQKNLEEQDHKVRETMNSFQAIDRSNAEISMQIGQIHDKLDNAKRMNSKLADSIHNVAAIAEETAAGVQEVNASSVKQVSAIHDIARQAVDINGLSQQLFKEVNVFQISDVTLEAEGDGDLTVADGLEDTQVQVGVEDEQTGTTDAQAGLEVTLTSVKDVSSANPDTAATVRANLREPSYKSA
ncbi:methyl-accepting chemotaxis protein [Paenibacillus sp. sgz500958]|uniref:methyl-accepting chemotaxis protein n=1 Tax=Paenibacillus sp. sgz500958 TaxID=3242475 RepID=UPI0036D356E0